MCLGIPGQIIEITDSENQLALVEVSGNIIRKDLVKLADTGVDIISSGSLTHSARNVDISLRID